MRLGRRHDNLSATPFHELGFALPVRRTASVSFCLALRHFLEFRLKSVWTQSGASPRLRPRWWPSALALIGRNIGRPRLVRLASRPGKDARANFESHIAASLAFPQPHACTSAHFVGRLGGNLAKIRQALLFSCDRMPRPRRFDSPGSTRRVGRRRRFVADRPRSFRSS
jgi:hypothetical protein